MSITRHDTNPLMSRAVEHNGVVYVAGLTADDRSVGMKEQTEQVLAKGCTLDLHAAYFPPGHCAQSDLAKANVLLRRDNAKRFEIIVRRSFADYLLAWLEHAGKDVGVRVTG